MSEESDSVSYRNGEAFVEGVRKIPLIQVFEHYEVRKKDAENVAETLGLTESNVRKGISYWRSRPEVYEDLEDRIEGYSSKDAVKPITDVVSGQDSDFGDAGSNQSSEDVVNDFLDGKEGLSRDNLVSSACYLDGLVSGVEWTRDGSELGVYVSGCGEEFSLTYAVEGESGPILGVDEQVLEDRLDEMYRNAVFESMS